LVDTEWAGPSRSLVEAACGGVALPQSYLADGVLVLAEERLQPQALGRSEGPDLGVGGGAGGLGEQAVEQPQQREGHEAALGGPAGAGEEGETSTQDTIR